MSDPKVNIGMIMVEDDIYQKVRNYCERHDIDMDESLNHAFARLEKIDNIDSEQNKRTLSTKEL